MIELWLNFTDENGNDQRVLVEGEQYTVGRSSSNDLGIANGKLSREHIKIDRFADVFVISEFGSSNGTTVNDDALQDPVSLKNGDRLNLGGGIEIVVEMVDPENPGRSPGGDGAEKSAGNETDDGAAVSASTSSIATHPSEPSGGGIPTSVFIIAPIMGVFVIVLLGGIVYFASSGNTPKPDNDDFGYSTDRDIDRPPKNKSGTSSSPETSNNSVRADDPPVNVGPPVNADPGSSPGTTVNLTDSEKCEQNAALFLRSIAQNDNKAFLTGTQAQIINAKIKQISSSGAIVENLNSARRSSGQIKALAISKNLKPRLLATAALAKLGTSKGDVLQTAEGMAETLDKLGTQIGSELSSDSLLMIAAYDQGAAGDFMKMRNMLQDLATKSTESSREVRTIWFLHKNGKISDSEYSFAIQFLAIGAIMQNPKDFGVNTDAVTL